MRMKLSNQPWKLVQNRIRGEGGREIDRFRGIEPPQDSPNGSEAWIGSVTRAFNAPRENPNLGYSETILPDGRRMYLADAIELDPEGVLGNQHLQLHGTQLGMLIKYLDAKKQYTLQAHPTRAFAKKMWGSAVGKEESWYVLGTRQDAQEPPYILLGFKEGITQAIFQDCYRQGDMKTLLDFCHKVPVSVGDVFHLGGGVPHALGAGCFVLEVQEPSELTVVPISQRVLFQRMFAGVTDDSQLPWQDEKVYEEKLFGAFIYDGCSYAENLRRWQAKRTTLRSGLWGREELLLGPENTGYFSFTRIDVLDSAPLRSTGFPQVAIVLDGKGALVFEGGAMPIHKADELFFPYHIPGLVIDGNVSIVFCHPEGVAHEWSG
jgi:mannose-6-phosphate isomerase